MQQEERRRLFHFGLGILLVVGIVFFLNSETMANPSGAAVMDLFKNIKDLFRTKPTPTPTPSPTPIVCTSDAICNTDQNNPCRKDFGDGSPCNKIAKRCVNGQCVTGAWNDIIPCNVGEVCNLKDECPNTAFGGTCGSKPVGQCKTVIPPATTCLPYSRVSCDNGDRCGPVGTCSRVGDEHSCVGKILAGKCQSGTCNSYQTDADCSLPTTTPCLTDVGIWARCDGSGSCVIPRLGSIPTPVKTVRQYDPKLDAVKN